MSTVRNGTLLETARCVGARRAATRPPPRHLYPASSVPRAESRSAHRCIRPIAQAQDGGFPSVLPPIALFLINDRHFRIRQTNGQSRRLAGQCFNLDPNLRLLDNLNRHPGRPGTKVNDTRLDTPLRGSTCLDGQHLRQLKDKTGCNGCEYQSGGKNRKQSPDRQMVICCRSE